MPSSAAQPVLQLFLPEGPPGWPARLRASLPDLVPTPLGFEIALGDRCAEEVLSCCIRTGVTVRATRIVERPPVDACPRSGGDWASQIRTSTRADEPCLPPPPKPLPPRPPETSRIS